MQLGFYFDQTRCIGCHTCTVACKDWHDVPPGPSSWIRVHEIESGKFPNVFVAYQKTHCYHCAKPACVSACPAGAITKDEATGIVSVDKDACLGRSGCPDMCLEVCPYKAPQFRADKDAKMEMCDLCQDRWSEHKLPICVAGCPMRALDAGPIEQLTAKYGQVTEASGFAYSAEVMPSIVFKPRRGRAKS